MTTCASLRQGSYEPICSDRDFELHQGDLQQMRGQNRGKAHQGAKETMWTSDYLQAIF